MTEYAPPSSKRSFLIALDRRLRDVPPGELPLVPRAVLRTLAGRANAGGIVWPALQTIAAESGTTATATIKRALKELLSLGWISVAQASTPRTSTVYQLHLERVPRETRQGARAELPEGAERAARGGGATPEDHKEDHKEAPKEVNARKRTHKENPCLSTSTSPKPTTPSRITQPSAMPEDHAPHAGAKAAAIAVNPPPMPSPAAPTVPPVAAPVVPPPPPCPPKTQLSLLSIPELDPADVVEAPPTSRSPAPAPASPPPLPARKRGSRTLPKAPKTTPEPKEGAATRYSRAWREGHAAAGGVAMPLSESEARLLGAVCASFALYRDGDPITGGELEQWIRAQVRDFRRAVGDPAYHRGGYTVHGFRAHLEQTARPSDRPRKPGAAEPPPRLPEPLPPPRRLPQDQAIAIARARVAELLGSEA